MTAKRPAVCCTAEMGTHGLETNQLATNLTFWVVRLYASSSTAISTHERDAPNRG